MNRRKINAQWMTILRAAKTAELKEEIEILMAETERVYDQKDAELAHNMQEFSESEAQRARLNYTRTYFMDEMESE